MQVQVAKTFRERLLGMNGVKDVRSTVLTIPCCRSVHTCFMRISIDIYFLDDDMRVVRKLTGVAPWSIRWCHVATHVLEIASDMAPEMKLWLEEALLKKSLTESHKTVYIPK